MVKPLSYFSFQPVLHDWCNKGRGMCYPVCGMVHTKEPLLLIGKRSLCCGSGFPFLLSECSFTICLSPYNRKYNVLSASLNNTFPSFLRSLVFGRLPQCCTFKKTYLFLVYYSPHHPPPPPHPPTPPSLIRRHITIK